MDTFTFSKKITVLLTVSLITFVAIAQNVTVTATAGTVGPTAYTNLSSAFAAINSGTHQGNIQVRINASFTDVATAVLNSSGAGSANYNSVNIYPTVDGVTVSFASASGRGVIELNGADNVTIDGDNPNTAGINRNLTITNTASNTTTYTSVIRLATSTLVTNCDNIQIKNCILNGSATGRNSSSFTSTSGSENTTFGIVAAGGASTISATTTPSAITSVSNTVPSGQTLTNLVITNNSIQTCARAVSINGSAVTVVPVLTITNNLIGNATAGDVNQVYAIGITAQGFSSGTVISGNTIYVENYIASSVTHGIALGSVSSSGTGAVVENNKILRCLNRSTGGWGVRGIDINAGNSNTVRNNFIANVNNGSSASFSTGFGAFGIRVAASTGHTICFNTVNISGVNPGSGSGLVACFGITGTGLTGLDVRNNIFSNTATGSGSNSVHVCVFLPSGGTSSMNLTLNNNAYYSGTTSGLHGILQVGTTYSGANLYTAANFNAAATTPSTNSRSYTSTLSGAGTNDNASLATTTAAPFVSATDLHIDLSNPGASALDNVGVSITGITTDIDGDSRTGPDIGADEFTLAGCTSATGGTASFTGGSTACAGGTKTMSVSGATTGTGVTYQWKVSTVSGGPYSNVSGGTGANTLTYTTGPLTAGTYYYVLEVTCANCGPCSNFSNEITLTVVNPATITPSASPANWCNGTGGTTTLSATGGVSYVWSSGTTTPNVTTTTTFTVTATDVNGCSPTASITVGVYNAVSATASASPATVCPGNTSTLTVNATQFLGYTVNTNSGVSFIDISGTGTSVGSLIDDGEYNITIPSFTFNGIAYTSARIGNNGAVALGSTTGDINATNAALPTTANTAGNVLLLPFWDDLYTTGNIYTQTVGSNFIIQYNNINHFSAQTGNITFQIQLNTLTGVISFVYNDVDFGNTSYNGGASATVGIQFSGTSAMQYSFNSASLTNGQSITYTPTNATFNYAWSNSGGYLNNPAIQSPTFTAPLSTGTYNYTVTATSNVGCTATATTAVNVASTTLSASATASPGTVCQGGSTTLSAAGSTGGCPPYSYAWADPSNNPVGGNSVSINVTPTASGSYKVTVTDNTGTTASAAVNVNVNANPTVTISPATASYCGTGSVTLTASGANSYNWSHGLGSGATKNVAPASTTTYSVTGTDANGCTASATSVVSVYPTLNTTVTPASITTCPAIPATLTASSTSLQTFSNSSTITIPSSGTATPYPSTITVSGLPVSGITVSSVSISGITHTWSGDIDILLESPTGQFLVPVSDIGSSSVTGVNLVFSDAASGTMSSFTSGTYKPTNNGAGDNFPAPGPGTSYTELTTLAGFTGNMNGTWKLYVMDDVGGDAGNISGWSITFTVPATGITYTWSPAAGLNTTSGPVVQASASNTYTVTAQDGNGCTATASSTVTVSGTPLSVNITGAANTCVGSTRTLTAVPTGGCASSYTYVWSDGLGTTVSVSPVITLVGANNYSVTVTDAGSNTASASVSVTGLAAPSASISPSTAKICGGSGSDTLTASGGGTYAWNTGATTAAISATNGADYVVTVTDANSCTATASRHVDLLPAFTFTGPTGTPNPVCAGSDANMSVSATYQHTAYSVTNVPLNYYTLASIVGAGIPNLRTSSPVTSGSLDDGYWTFDLTGIGLTVNLFGQNYSSVSVGTNGNIMLGSLTTTGYGSGSAIPAVAAPNAYIAGIFADLNLSSSGGLYVFTTGTAPNRELVAHYEAVPFFSGGGTATFQIIYSEATGTIEIYTLAISNTSTIKTQGIENAAGTFGYPIPGRNATTNWNSVPNGVMFSPVTPSMNYVWSNTGGYLNNTNIANPVAQAVAATTIYNVTATDAFGCTAVSSNYTLTTQSVPVVSASNTGPYCSGTGTITLSSLPNSASAYTWSGPGGFSDNTQNTTNGTPDITKAGTYTVTVTGTNGCTASGTTNVVVNGVPVANAGPDLSGLNTQTFNINGSASNYSSFSWATSGIGTLTNTGTLTPTYTPGVGETGVVTVTLTVNGIAPCGSTSDFMTITLSGPAITWLGHTTSWHTATNWNPATVPNNCSVNVLIPSNPVGGNYPEVNSVVSVGNVQMGNGARITLNQKLNICGNVTGGNLASNMPAVIGTSYAELNGSATQTISGRVKFNTLRLNNGNGAQLASGSFVDIITALELQHGTFTTTGGTLTFKSGAADEYAILDNFSNPLWDGVLAGNAKVERYVPVSGFNQHYFGTPIVNATFSQLGASGTPGYLIPKLDCDKNQMANNSPYGTVFEWHDDDPDIPLSGCLYHGWEVKTSGVTEAGKGYSVYLNQGVFTITGNINQGTSYSVSGLNNIGWATNNLQTAGMLPPAFNSGWHIVANPFLAPLELGGHTPDFDDAAVWVTSGPYQGTYQPVAITGGSIAPFQGFIVHRSGATAKTFTFNKSECRTTQGVSFYKTASEHALSINVSGNGYNDITYVEYNSDATNTFDVNYDSRKLLSNWGQPTIYTNNSDGITRLSRNTNRTIAESPNIPLNFLPGTGGSYTFTFEGINTFDPTTYMFIEDKQTGVWTDIRQNPVYTFQSNAGDAIDRFVLHFTPAAIIKTTEANCQKNGTLYMEQPGTASWNYTITNSQGNIIHAGVLNNSNSVILGVPTGTYTLTLTDNSGYTVVKMVTVNGVSPITATINASSTTAEVGQAITFGSNANAASTEWDMGDGVVYYTQQVTHQYLQPGVYTVTLTVTNSDGCVSSATQLITVTEAQSTGIHNNIQSGINIFSFKNTVVVDFGKANNINATIDIYNVMGQLLLSERTQNKVYARELQDMSAAYIIIRVNNNGEETRRKLFLYGGE